ncbi:hypothetical protein CSUI_005320, partial [Cystoisospora suis]
MVSLQRHLYQRSLHKCIYLLFFFLLFHSSSSSFIQGVHTPGGRRTRIDCRPLSSR